MKIDYDYLRERLRKCPHAYEDFVEGTIVKIKQEATEQEAPTKEEIIKTIKEMMKEYNITIEDLK